MPIDRAAAETFIWSTARVLDRHRYAMLFGAGPSEPVLAALAAYRNPDGGFGHALEPDLRCPGSQPAPTLSALETLHEAGALGGELARGARTWVRSVAAPDGGIPFAVDGFEDYPHAPFWSPEPASFLTFGAAAVLHSGGVTDDDWLSTATRWCWEAIARAERPSGYWLKFACAFLDAVPDEDRAHAAVASLSAKVDASSMTPAGGAEGEALRPLDLSPRPGSRTRALVSADLIEAHLDAVENAQAQDGGWMFDWLAWSPAQTADWRGIVTIHVLTWLRDNGRAI